VEPAPRVEGTPAAASEPLPIDVIRRWIESRHPNIVAGDAHVNAVIIVVDANNQYLASATDSIADSGRVGDWLNFRVMDPSNRVPLTSAPQPVIYVDGVIYENSDRIKAKPVLIVDGVRLENIEQLDSIAIKSVEVLKGPAAAASYGADAANGVIVVTSKPRMTVDLSRFGIDAQSVSEMTEFRLRPGVVGPNRLYITVLQIKKR
jgi:TonB-dependent SusC/RagA subfamily outer membrane receptor